MFNKKLKKEIDSLGKSVALTQAGILFLSDEVKVKEKRINERVDGLLEVIIELSKTIVSLKKRVEALEEQKVEVKDESKKATKVKVRAEKKKRGRPVKK